jgi:hypothetical protein
MDSSFVKVKKPTRPCPKCPHRLSDLWMHETSPEPEPSISEVSKEETSEDMVNEEGVVNTAEAHDPINEATASLPPAYPVTISSQTNPPDYSETAHKSDEAKENLHTEDEPKKVDDSSSSSADVTNNKLYRTCHLLPPHLRGEHECDEVEKDDSTEHQGKEESVRSSSPGGWDHLYTCPACLGEHPKPVQSDTTNATLSGSGQGESSKSAEDKEVLGGRKQTTSDWPKIAFRSVPVAKNVGRQISRNM